MQKLFLFHYLAGQYFYHDFDWNMCIAFRFEACGEEALQSVVNRYITVDECTTACRPRTYISDCNLQ